MGSKYHSKYPQNGLLKLKENDYEEFANLNEDRPVGARLVPSNVQLTLKPGIANGGRPSMCFCKPPAKRKSNNENMCQRYGSQSNSAISSKGVFTNHGVGEQDYSQFYLDLLSNQSSCAPVIQFGTHMSRNDKRSPGGELIDDMVLVADKQTDHAKEHARQRNYQEISGKQIHNAQISNKQINGRQINDGQNSLKQSDQAQLVHDTPTSEAGVVEISQQNALNVEELGLKEDHAEDHATKHPSVCGVCLQEFPSVLSLENHQKEKGHYICSECGEAFCDDAAFREHSDKKLCKTAICIFCDQRFVTRDELEDHKSKVHHKCLECNKLYNSAEKLLAHNERHHGAPYTCLQCGEEFSTYSLCKKHTTNRHKKKKFYCPECGRGFTRINILHRHATYTHSDEKKFQCEVCSKTFKRPDALKIHMITHSEKKPFRCEKCGKQFTQKVCYNKHIPCKQQNKNSKRKNTVAQTMVNMQDKFNIEPNTLSDHLNSFSEICENESYEILSASSQGNAAVWKKVNETNLMDGKQIYMGCRCPPSCRCKKFSIGLKVQTGKPKGSILDSAEEIASLSCCCDIELQDV